MATGCHPQRRLPSAWQLNTPSTLPSSFIAEKKMEVLHPMKTLCTSPALFPSAFPALKKNNHPGETLRRAPLETQQEALLKGQLNLASNCDAVGLVLPHDPKHKARLSPCCMLPRYLSHNHTEKIAENYFFWPRLMGKENQTMWGRQDHPSFSSKEDLQWSQSQCYGITSAANLQGCS